MKHPPTDEQINARDLFLTGDNLAIEAGAGTGKTSTLEVIADSAMAFGQYIAFNRAIVEEAERRMPNNMRANTAHSLAYRAVGHKYKGRLYNSARMPSWKIAELLGVDAIRIHVDGEPKLLSTSYLGGLVMRSVTRFCQSVDMEPNRTHVPYIDGIDALDANGKRTYANNNAVAKHIEDHLVAAWEDLLDPHGSLPYKHDHYLKLWHLSNPKIDADFVLFDEAQDANPVLVDIVAMQKDAQLVWVGDSQQAIYGFTGAINALAGVPHDKRAFLTHSFRFGEPIADVANQILGMLDAELRLVGNDKVRSTVIGIPAPDVVLTRTNAVAVNTVLRAQERGEAVHLVGGGDEVVRFAEAAEELQSTGKTSHPDLACFASWRDVQHYVNHDAQGHELKLLVSLVDRFSSQTIRRALGRMIPENRAGLVVSTAHKAKGREWGRVKLSDDYPADGKEELRLLYVACTRAKNELDIDEIELLADGQLPAILLDS